MREKRRFIKVLPILLIAMMVVTVMGGAAGAQTNEAYWTDDSGVRFTYNEIYLSGDATQIIRLSAEVPDGKTLQAYNFIITYDTSVVEVVKIEKRGFTLFTNNTPGTITFNGFTTDTMIYTGPTTIELIDVTIKGLKEGNTDFNIIVNNFGSSPDVQFPPIVIPLSINTISCDALAMFTAIPRTGMELLIADFDTTGSVGTLLFDYGDGTTGADTTHTYDAADTYTVTMTATGIDGCTDTATQTVTLNTQVVTVGSSGHIITVTPPCDNGTAYMDGYPIDSTVQVADGATPTFTFEVPNTDYMIDDVKVDGISFGSVNKIRFTNPVTSDHTIDITCRKVGIVQYVITATAEGNGTISPTGEIVVTEGDTSEFTFIPDDDYRIADVLVDNVSVGNLSSYTFTNVIDNHTIHVLFEESVSYTITATAGDNGTIEPAGEVVVNKGESKTFFFTPAEGFVIKDVLIDELSVGVKDSHTFDNVSTNHTIYVTFKPVVTTYTITSTAEGNGTISPADSITVNEGNTPTFTFTPDPNNKIKEVLVDDVSVGKVANYTFEPVIADHTIHVIFEESVAYIITATAEEYGTISPSGNISVTQGASQSFTFTPDAGYVVENVIVDNSSVGSPTNYTFTEVMTDHSINVTFRKADDVTYTITTSAGTGGTISPLGTILVVKDENQTLNFIPSTGYKIADVLVDGVSKGKLSSYTFEAVNENHTIHVSFESDYYTITATAGTGGTISPNGEVIIDKDTELTFIFTPDTGYTVKDLLVDGSSLGKLSKYTFTKVTADHSIHVIFEKLVQYTITATAEGNGIISPSGEIVVTEGNSETFTFTPDTQDYIITDVLVDGVSHGKLTSYTFSDVTSSHTIHVIFNSYNSSNTATLISPTDESTFASGTVTFHISTYTHPDENPYYQTHWLVARSERTDCVKEICSEYYQITNDGATQHTVSGLEPGLKYIWRVGYEDAISHDISWSDETRTFKVGTSQADHNVSIPAGSEAADFRMVSFVQWLDDPDAESVFGDEIGAYDTKIFRIGTYDLFYYGGSYREYGENLKIEPGRAYWFYAKNGVNITANGVPVSLDHDIEVRLYYNSDTNDGWNMIACPNNADYQWNELKIIMYDENGKEKTGFPKSISELSDSNTYIDKRLWRWEDGTYYSDTEQMQAYQGYWIKAKQANVFLRFPADVQSDSKTLLVKLNQGKRLLNSLLTPEQAVADSGDSPPMPISGFTSSADDDKPVAGSGDGGGGCFIGETAIDSSSIMQYFIILIFILVLAIIFHKRA